MHHQLGSRSPKVGGGGGARRDEESNGATNQLLLAGAKPLGGRRYRRGDIALTILGISILILSVLHIVLHSGNVPHLNHPIKAGTDSGKLLISPLHAKLKEFVNAGNDKKMDNTRRDNREIPLSKVDDGKIKPQPDSQPPSPANNINKKQTNHVEVTVISAEPPKSNEKGPPITEKSKLNLEHDKSNNKNDKMDSIVNVVPTVKKNEVQSTQPTDISPQLLPKKGEIKPNQGESNKSVTEPSKIKTVEATTLPSLKQTDNKPKIDENKNTTVQSVTTSTNKEVAPQPPKKDESKPNLDSKNIAASQSVPPKSEAPLPPKKDASDLHTNAPVSLDRKENIPPNPLNIADIPHPVAHLNCDDHGGPKNKQIIDEMVFWSDIPSDSEYLSPMHPLLDPHTPDDVERYLTFEPDHGGWNNIRMAMETALVMSHAMGRTLVLPPEQRMYLIDKAHSNGQRNEFGFNDFFHLDAISIEHKGFKVITMEEFLTRVGMTGELQGIYPPANQTNWSGNANGLWDYLRTVGYTPEWDPWVCALAIPASTDPQSVVELNTTLQSIMDGSYGKPKPTLQEFNGKPTPVNASMAERMREMLADRSNLCIYDKPLQETKLIHLKIEKNVRLLTHFYAFIFFADWRQDLWSKRFVRDHLRYVDDIMCAAARVIEAVREHAKKSGLQRNISREYDVNGAYDGMHVRRGDFQYPPTQLPAEKLHELSPMLTKGATLYVATDERDKSFFDVFRKDYDLVFLDDFLHVIPDVNTNYYGMIDQLVSYKSRIFYGTWWSTLSGYVNRMRGYYITKHKLDGYKDGTMDSYYFTPSERVMEMKTEYIPVRFPIYCREFPTSWRDIDCGIEELYDTTKVEKK